MSGYVRHEAIVMPNRNWNVRVLILALLPDLNHVHEAIMAGVATGLLRSTLLGLGHGHIYKG